MISEFMLNIVRSATSVQVDPDNRRLRIQAGEHIPDHFSTGNDAIGKAKLSPDGVNFGREIIRRRYKEKSVQLEDLKDQIREELLKNGFDVEFLRDLPARLTDKNNPYIQTCLQTYRMFTWDKNAQPRINAGGTYAMFLPCSAEIGTTTIWGSFKDMPNGHGAVHQPDECISINGFLEAIELMALMVLACDKVER